VNYLDVLILVAPETIVAVTAFLVLGLDMGLSRRQPIGRRFGLNILVVTIGCLAAMLWLSQSMSGRTVKIPGSAEDILVLSSLTAWLKIFLLALTMAVAWMATESSFTHHAGEYLALLLFATVAMMFLVSAENLLMIFLALEFLSLCLYTMTAFHRQSVRSAEAALKYFLFGGMSAAFLLFGFSLVYGLTGELTLTGIGLDLAARKMDPLLALALVMVAVGFGFKIAAVPFHLWAPDAYQGAPGPTAAFIASGSKVASFFILAKLLAAGFGSAAGAAAWRGFTTGWLPLLAILAAASVILGNVAAIAQTSVRRLLAYSAVAHAGYALIGVLAFGERGIASLLYYVVTYAFTVLGAFGVVAILEQRVGHDGFAAFAGLSRRAPILSLCMLIFMLSLAGIPPLAGFFGKFYVFAAALSAGKDLALLWLVILAIAMSAVSLYYYLQVLKQIYVVPGEGAPVRAAWPAQLGIVLLAAAVVALGIAPNLLLAKLAPAIQAAWRYTR
jgi:NADH-quinone oxidoreductase subunit N